MRVKLSATELVSAPLEVSFHRLALFVFHCLIFLSIIIEKPYFDPSSKSRREALGLDK